MIPVVQEIRLLPLGKPNQHWLPAVTFSQHFPAAESLCPSRWPQSGVYRETDSIRMG